MLQKGPHSLHHYQNCVIAMSTSDNKVIDFVNRVHCAKVVTFGDLG